MWNSYSSEVNNVFSLDGSLGSEMCAPIFGVETQRMKFNFLFGVCLGSHILRNSDNLSKTFSTRRCLQQKVSILPSSL